MRRDQLEHAIRTACQIIGHDAVVVVGSQSILGSFTEAEFAGRSHHVNRDRHPSPSRGRQ